ncbi:MAG: hypothetical protein HDS84_00150 [Bacteroidales bacterium]|nr:hypothetical protein [Bacteroidales bacterium]
MPRLGKHRHFTRFINSNIPRLFLLTWHAMSLHVPISSPDMTRPERNLGTKRRNIL